MDYTQYRCHEIVRLILDGNPAGHSPKQIAAHMEISLSNLLKWGEDPESSGSEIPTKHLKNFSRITNDRRLLEWFLLSTFPDRVKGALNGDVIDNLLAIDILRGNFVSRLQEAYKDKKIDRSEGKALRDILAGMRVQIDTAVEEINLLQVES